MHGAGRSLCGACAQQLTNCGGIAGTLAEMAIRTSGSEASQSHCGVMDVNVVDVSADMGLDNWNN